jgi:hypothetical protein
VRVLGIDPGAKGSAAIIDFKNDKLTIDVFRFEKGTEYDLAAWFCLLGKVDAAALEKIHGMPNQGAGTTFTQGRNYGMVIGLLIANDIPYRDVTPQKWQKEFLNEKERGNSDDTTKHKNILKSKAQQLYTGKVTLDMADAILIAEYMRRVLIKERSCQ